MQEVMVIMAAVDCDIISEWSLDLHGANVYMPGQAAETYLPTHTWESTWEDGSVCKCLVVKVIMGT